MNYFLRIFFSSVTLNCSKKSPVPLLVQKAYTNWKLRISHFHDGAMRKNSSYIGCNAKSFHGWLAKNHLGPRDSKSFHTSWCWNHDYRSTRKTLNSNKPKWQNPNQNTSSRFWEWFLGDGKKLRIAGGELKTGLLGGSSQDGRNIDHWWS